MNIPVVNTSKHDLPQYHTQGSAGLDLRANLEQPITLQPLQRALVPTGIHLAIPQGYEAQIRPRSGLALKHGISLVNTPGTIDSDYRGEISVIAINLSDQPFTINDGERIAQIVINKIEQITWQPVDQLDTTERGAGGYGHTGK